MKKLSPKLTLGIKAAVTVALVAFIVSRADWVSVGDTLKNADPVLIAAVFLLMVFCVCFSAYKWQKLLAIHGAHFKFRQLNRWYFVAMFFNNFLPTSIGGDGYRIWQTLDNQRSRTAAVVAVFAERLSGILTLLLIGFVGALIGWVMSGHVLSRTVGQFGVLGLIIGLPILAWLFVFGGLEKLGGMKRLPKMLRTVFEHVDDYTTRPGEAAWAVLGISVIFHFISLFWMGLLLRAVGASVTPWDLAVIASLISVITVLPISINGIGVVDGAFIWLAGQYGVAYESALGFMLLQRALLIPISIAGAVFYFTARRVPKEGVDLSTEADV